jgi:hypothetical protein
MAFSIAERYGKLIMVQPEIPEGFEPTIEWIGPTTARVMTGPLAGSELQFKTEDGRVSEVLAGGVIPIKPTDRPPPLTPGAGLKGPAFQPDPDRDEVFRSAWDHRHEDGILQSPPEYPTHALVQWLEAREEFIFHGSNRVDIYEFRPRRESLEIQDVGGRGNLEAVYGTHEGLWAMFFAIVDRSKIRGSIRNGVGTYSSGPGETIHLYQFSIEKESLAARPFCPGTLYVLSRESFDRIPLYPGGPLTNEWACFDPVTPLARIPVKPDGFPFLDRIGAHDDSNLLRLADLTAVVFTHVRQAERTAGGIQILLDDDLTPEVRDEWITLGSQFYPDVTQVPLDKTRIALSGPPGYIHETERRLGNLLD